MPAPQVQSEGVAAVFAAYPPDLRRQLLELRSLIFEVAENTPGVGRLEEMLKWGQPAYLTSASRSGTTVRIDADSGSSGDYALYVNCQTNLVEQWRRHYPDLSFSGTRAILFKRNSPLPHDAVAHCVGMALTYHARKKGGRG
jgi:hypothetical protein